MYKRRRLLLTIPGCPFCARAKEELNTAGVSYEELEVDKYERSLVEKLSGQSTVPILVEVIGCESQDDEIVEYAKSGETK
jgi:glutaredoxin